MAGILIFCLVAVATAEFQGYNFQRGLPSHPQHHLDFKQDQAVELPILQIPHEIQAHIDSRTSEFHSVFRQQSVSHGHFMNNAAQNHAAHTPSNHYNPFVNRQYQSLPPHESSSHGSFGNLQSVNSVPTFHQPQASLAPQHHTQVVHQQHVQDQQNFNLNHAQQFFTDHQKQFQFHQQQPTVFQTPNHHSPSMPVSQHYGPPFVQQHLRLATHQPDYRNSLPSPQLQQHSSPVYDLPSTAPHQNQFHQNVPEPTLVQLPPVHEQTYATHPVNLNAVNHAGEVPLVTPLVTKNFYFHIPPEEKEEPHTPQTHAVGPVHKHYRVIFIKAPAQSPRAALVRLAQAQATNEEKTVIYVLSKKTDPAELQAQLQQTTPKNHKPEVFFIKYKTPDEAAHAQQQIQAQYDALGGVSHFSDEGLAPITSVVGSLDEASAASAEGDSSQSSVTKEYLPPSSPTPAPVTSNDFNYALPAQQNNGYLPPVP